MCTDLRVKTQTTPIYEGCGMDFSLAIIGYREGGHVDLGLALRHVKLTLLGIQKSDVTPEHRR
jgi:hypothetical protein